MPQAIPTALIQKRCQGTDGGTNGEPARVCSSQATYIVRLFKGDEDYFACTRHAELMEPFERGEDWVEYARNERK